jgi:Protein of unknown function (DUF2795)
MATTPIWTYKGVDTGVDLTGYEVEARDGSIGTVEESTMQAGQSYLVVDTGPWIFGRRVLLPAGVVDRVSTNEEKVFVSRSREEIKNAPEYGEPGATETYRQQIGSYYGGLGEPFPASRMTQRQTTSGRRLSSTSRRQTSSRRQTTSRKASKQSSSSRGSTRARSRSRGKTNEGPTRDELYEQAKRLNIDGRSKMNKAQLSRAVGRKRGGSSSTQSRRSSTTTRRKANPVDVQKFLDGVSYPTRKGDLIREAERKRASQKVRSTLKRLPDKRFADPTEVSEAVGKLR